MIALKEPIGRFVAFANLKKDIFSQKSVRQDVEDLVDLITIRSQDDSVEDVANSLLENIFDLRIDVLEWLVDSGLDLQSFSDAMSKHISVNLQLAPYSDLAKAISAVLLAYEKIVSPIFENLSNSFKEMVGDIKKNKPEYETFKMLAFHPAPQISYLKNWVDASLQLEVGIILADLILTNQIQFGKRRIKNELINFLFSTITKFGAYSIFTGFWMPDADDVSDLTNSMKILSATIELDNKMAYKTSKDAFFKMVNN